MIGCRHSELERTCHARAWSSLIRQLVAAGFLKIDIKGFGGLSITDKGRGLLKGEAEFRYRAETLGARKPRERKPKSVEAAVELASLDAGGADLLQRLKALRFTLASERRVPAYVIFHDRTLIDMAAKAPMSLDQMAEIHGVGAAKLESFGQIFLDEIKAGRAEDAA